MAKSVLVDLDFGSSSKVTGLPTPTLASDAVTKAYVDALPPVASVRAARIYRNTNQSIPTGAGYTSLVWSTADYEIGGDFWTSGATTTVPETGVFQITSEATFDTTGLLAMTTCNMQVLLNGATVIGEDEVQVAINAKGSLFVFAQRSFTVGDTILVQVKHSDAGSVNIATQATHSPDIIFAKVGGAAGQSSTDLLLQNTQSGATYTYVLTDINKMVTAIGANPTFTIPLNASVPFTIGTQFTTEHQGTGRLTVNVAVGGTINGVSAGSFTLEVGQEAQCWKTGTDAWRVVVSPPNTYSLITAMSGLVFY